MEKKITIFNCINPLCIGAICLKERICSECNEEMQKGSLAIENYLEFEKLVQKKKLIRKGYDNLLKHYANKSEVPLAYYEEDLVEKLTNLKEFDSNLGFTYFNIGLAYIENDKFNKALEAFIKHRKVLLNRSSQSDSNHALNYHYLAKVFKAKKDYTMAIKYSEKEYMLKTGFLDKYSYELSDIVKSISELWALSGNIKNYLYYSELSLKIEKRIT